MTEEGLKVRLPPHALDSGCLPGERDIPSLSLSHKKMLRDKTFSDLALSCSVGKTFTHSFMIMLRAPEVLNTKDKQNLQKKKQQKGGGGNQAFDFVLPKSLPAEVAPKILWQLFEFIYQGFVTLSALTPQEVLYLDHLAKAFKVDRLAYLCELYLRDTLNNSNLPATLRLAEDLKEASVKNFCMAFALKNYQAFISNKDGVYICGLDLFQEVVSRNADPTPIVDERGAVPPNSYVDHMKQLHDEMLFADGLAKVNNGPPLRFHKAVLAAHSEQLAAHIRAHSDADVPFNLSAESFKAMLRFIYYGEATIEPISATELIAFSAEYGLPDVQKACEGRITANVAVGTVIEILGVTYLPHMQSRSDVLDLRASAISFLLANLAQVDLSLLKKMDPSISRDVVLACQQRERGTLAAPVKSFTETAIAVLSSPRGGTKGSAIHNAPLISPRKGAADPKEAQKREKEEKERKDKEEKERKEKEEKERKEKEERDKKAAKEAEKQKLEKEKKDKEDKDKKDKVDKKKSAKNIDAKKDALDLSKKGSELKPAPIDASTKKVEKK
jgi:hypothetical protein